MIKPMPGVVATAVAAALLVGCAPDQSEAETRADQSAADQVTEAEHRERAQEAYRAFEAGVQAEDPEAALAVWSEDVRVRGVGPGLERLDSRQAYADQLGGMSSAGLSLESLDVQVGEVIVLGDHVFEMGTFDESLRMEGAEEAIEIRGAYAALWRLEEDGAWRIYRFMWNEQPEGEA